MLTGQVNAQLVKAHLVRTEESDHPKGSSFDTAKKTAQ